MIYPIHLYGLPVLRKVAEDVTPDFEGLEQLIQDMYQTLEASDGIGLAAPQIGIPKRILVVDLTILEDELEPDQQVKMTMLNAQILERSGENETMEEGCLSLPGISEKVTRKNTIRVRYQNEKFETIESEFSGFLARVIQHEYDHLDGMLFIDHLSPIRKQLIKGKLKDILQGKARCDYRTKSAQ
ncbi:peptide deformylase [Porphyromonadaceae bacterium]